MNESEEEEEQRDHSILSNIVEVISGAKQSATTEFDRFCENIGWKPKTRPVLVRNKRDETKVQAGESVHGRIVPDSYRRKIGKDMEIQTDDFSQQNESETLKRRPSTRNVDGLNEDHRPTKISKQTHFVSISKRGESVRPVQFSREDTVTPVQSPIKNVLQQPAANRGSGSSSSDTSYYSTASNTLANNRDDSMDIEPREIIPTGSKSVKRLTSELEKVFSAQKIPTFKKPKTEHSLPLREEHHLSPNIGKKSPHRLSPNTKQEPVRQWTHNVEPKWTPHIEPESTPNVEMSENSIESDMDEEIESAPPEAPPQPPPLPPLLPSTPIQISQGENKDVDKLGREEQRMRLLERKLSDIHCQMNNFAARNSNDSPTPSHVRSTESPISPAIESNSPIRPTLKPASPIRQGALKPVSPFRQSTLVPASPISSYSPDRNLSGSSSSLRKTYHTPSPIADQLKYFQGLSSPIPKPNDKHISKMRVIIQQIPAFQLRKTDKIIGPDGEERPNPVWHEIYGKRRRL